MSVREKAESLVRPRSPFQTAKSEIGIGSTTSPDRRLLFSFNALSGYTYSRSLVSAIHLTEW